MKKLIVTLVVGSFLMGIVFSFGIGANAAGVSAIDKVLNKVTKMFKVVKKLENYAKASVNMDNSVANLVSIAADNSYRTCLWNTPAEYMDKCRYPKIYYKDLSSVDQNKYIEMRNEIKNLREQGIK